MLLLCHIHAHTYPYIHHDTHTHISIHTAHTHMHMRAHTHTHTIIHTSLAPTPSLIPNLHALFHTLLLPPYKFTVPHLLSFIWVPLLTHQWRRHLQYLQGDVYSLNCGICLLQDLRLLICRPLHLCGAQYLHLPHIGHLWNTACEFECPVDYMMSLLSNLSTILWVPAHTCITICRYSTF